MFALAAAICHRHIAFTLFESHHHPKEKIGCNLQSLRTASCSLWILPRPKNRLSPACFYTSVRTGAGLSNPIYRPPHKNKTDLLVCLIFMGWVMGFEPTNTGTTIRGLRPLGDTHHICFLRLPGGTRCVPAIARRDSFAFLPLAKMKVATSVRTGVSNSPPDCCILIVRVLRKTSKNQKCGSSD